MHKMLIALLAFGLGAATLTGSSIYAPGSDSGNIGRFDVSSGNVSAVDILMAPVEQGGVCGTFVEAANLKVDVSIPDDETKVKLVEMCIKNNGRVPIDVAYSFVILESSELACSPGEAEAGDTTCGEGPGELEYYTSIEWHTPTSRLAVGTQFSQNRVFAENLAPGDTIPVLIDMVWSGENSERAESDLLQMDATFDATAS